MLNYFKKTAAFVLVTILSVTIFLLVTAFAAVNVTSEAELRAELANGTNEINVTAPINIEGVEELLILPLTTVNITADGALTFLNGTNLTNNGIIEIHGVLKLLTGFVNNGANSNGTINIRNNGLVEVGATFSNGSLNSDGEGIINIDGGSLRILKNWGLYSFWNGSNAPGTINILSGLLQIQGSDLYNGYKAPGTINITGGSLVMDSHNYFSDNELFNGCDAVGTITVSNKGSMNINEGDVINGYGTANGIISIENGGIINANGGYFRNGNTTNSKTGMGLGIINVKNDGIMKLIDSYAAFNRDILNVNGGTFECDDLWNYGEINVTDGGIFNIISEGELRNTDNISSNPKIKVDDGTFKIGENALLYIDGKTIMDINPNGSVVVDAGGLLYNGYTTGSEETLNINGGFLAVNGGRLTNGYNSVININSGKLDLNSGGVFENYGMTASVNINGGELCINDGGSYFNGGLSYSPFGYFEDRSITNINPGGVLTINTGGRLINGSRLPIYSQGEINITAGGSLINNYYLISNEYRGSLINGKISGSYNIPIKFDANGGTLLSYDVQYGKIGSPLVEMPNVPWFTTSFKGWYDGKPYGKTWTASTPVTEPTTIHAKWYSNLYTVTYDLRGGVSETKNQLSAERALINMPVNPTREGFYFVGWYKDPSLTDPWNFKKDPMPGNDLTLYARWADAVYNVNFNSQGGSSVKGFQTFEGVLLKRPADPEKPGTCFGGWFTDSACTIAWDFAKNKMHSANLTLYAKWTDILFNVNFDFQLPIWGEIYTIQAAGGSLISRLEEVYYSEYNFCGWFMESECENIWDFSAYSMPNHDITLYAKWNSDLHDVFEVNYDTGNGSYIKSILSASGVLLSEPAEPKDYEYIFDGWYTDSAYINKWNFSEDVMPNVDITLYAKWRMENDDILGDVNDDGKITTADAVLVLQHIAKIIVLEDQELIVADVNKDGKITTADSVMLLQYIAKIIPSF